MQDKTMQEHAIKEFFARLYAQNPTPQGELYHTNPFTLLVAVVLSAQATDKGVNKATRPLFAQISTPEAMVAMGEETLCTFIKSINLYKTKAKYIINLSQMLIDEYNSCVPHTREALMRLSGVGRKSANVVLNIAFGQPTMAVDTHIFRVSNRTGLGIGKTPEAVERALEERVPEEYRLHAHHWLILHGRYICTARTPQCTSCPVSDLCLWESKTAPNSAKKKKP